VKLTSFLVVFEVVSGYAQDLSREPTARALEELMDMCRRNAMAGGAACNPIIFEPMAMSILLAHQKKIVELEHKVNETRV